MYQSWRAGARWYTDTIHMFIVKSPKMSTNWARVCTMSYVFRLRIRDQFCLIFQLNCIISFICSVLLLSLASSSIQLQFWFGSKFKLCHRILPPPPPPPPSTLINYLARVSTQPMHDHDQVHGQGARESLHCKLPCIPLPRSPHFPVNKNVNLFQN